MLQGKQLRQVQNVTDAIFKHVDSKKWCCMAEGCHETSINSHLLMRNGILNYVAENGKVVELRAKAIEAIKKGDNALFFKEVGISQAISLPIFCKLHDTTLFKEIESGDVDYNNYRHVALYCYRAICAARRKKEKDRERDSRLLKSNILKELAPYYLSYLSTKEYPTELALGDLDYYKSELIHDLNTGRESFSFFRTLLPVRGIYASTVSSMFMSGEEAMTPSVANILFVHLIPVKEGTMLIVGYHKEHESPNYNMYIDSWKRYDKSKIGSKLTGILVQSENWGISPSLYAQLNKDRIEEFLQIFKEEIYSFSQSTYEDIDLFQGVSFN